MNFTQFFKFIDIEIFIGENLKPISYKRLDKKDKKRVKKIPNLLKNLSFIVSRNLKFKLRKKLKSKKYCLCHKNDISAISLCKFKTGIDIEEIKIRNFDNIVKFCFCEDEKKLYLQSSNKILTFYKIYTTKEAALKRCNLNFCDIEKINYFEVNKYHIEYGNYLITLVY